jgi:ABC-2 type transport system ATP-binding protein
MTPPLASAEAVSRRFGSVEAVSEVSMEVRAGEVVGLLGANGAGKTTLIRLLLGLLRATEGRVRLFGQQPSRATRRRLGYVPQGLGLYEDLTVQENLAFSAAVFGSARPRLEGDLAQSARDLVRHLPLGVRRRVAFAEALAHGPELLVLDEPTSGVDPLGRARLWETVRGAAEAGAGALVTTHHMDEAEYCDRLVVMAAGRVVAAGSMASIVDDARTVEVRSDRWPQAYKALDRDAAPLALVGRALRLPEADPVVVRRRLEEAKIPASVEVVPATFEETFVRLSREAR